MKGDKTRIILDALADAAQNAGELLDVFFATYHESYRRARNHSMKRTPFSPYTAETAERRRFYNLLVKLNAEGFIQKAPKRTWRLTKRGFEKRDTLHTQRAATLPHARYAVEPSAEWNIVMFDVPEREKRKRNWLRAALVRMGFRQLQKSVFAGRIELPALFLHDLRRLRLLTYVEIFSITKTGSLKHVA